MPDFFFADLVRESSTGTGTGTIALEGATPGHRRFADAVPSGSRFHYVIAGVTHEQQWEVGEGEIADGTLVRLEALASSAGGAAVDFLAGLKIVTLTVASAWFAAREDRSGHGHAIDQVAGLQTALDGKQPVGSYAGDEHGHGSLAFSAGSAAVPSITFSGDGDTGLFSSGTNALAITTGGQERARFTADGQLAVGLETPEGGLHVRWTGFNPDANNAAALILEGHYGGGIAFRDGAGSVGMWTSDFGETFNIGMGATNPLPSVQITPASLRPAFDNNRSLGSAALRWSQLYAGSGTINTSDARAKHWLGPPGAQDIAAGRALLAQLGLFQWTAARDAKGADGARLHFGLRAQNAFAVLGDYGLDWRSYGWCCHDQWEDEDGLHDRFGIRPDELALFLIAVLAQQIADLESRLEAGADAGA